MPDPSATDSATPVSPIGTPPAENESLWATSDRWTSKPQPLPGMVAIWMDGYRCERCDHEWVPRDKTQAPKICPRCKSPYWDRPRRTPKESKNFGDAGAHDVATDGSGHESAPTGGAE